MRGILREKIHFNKQHFLLMLRENILNYYENFRLSNKKGKEQKKSLER